MKLAILFATTLALLAPSAAALACDGHGAKVPQITLEDGSKLSKAKKAVFVDANGAETRQKYGVIPGAVLLTSATEFATSELPAQKDQALVFYCANEHCGASKAAAKRAVMAGYVHVSVLPEGIMGWKKAGLPTSANGDRS